MANDRAYMTEALAACRQGIEAGQTPFGACIVREGEILSTAHNHVWDEKDITAHAEICALRQACRTLGKIDLTGAVIYSTTEPCPMCFAAIHWARIDRIVYGACIADAAEYGFNELRIANHHMKALANLNVEIVPDFMRDEVLALFAHWQAQGGKPY